MAAKIGTVIAAIAGTVALGTGGYFANEWRTCNALKVEFGEHMVAIATNLQSAKAAGDAVGRDTFERRALELAEPANRAFFQIRERCGEVTAKEAMTKALQDRDEITPPASRPL